MAKVSTKVLAVTLVVAIVTAGATFVLLTDVPATHSGRSDTLWKSEGPSLLAHVHISGTAPPQTSGLNTFLELTQQFSDVKSQLFLYSPIPNSLNHNGAVNLSSMNQSSNPYQVLLYNDTSNETGVFTGYLSNSFYQIVNEWKAVLIRNNMSITTSVSLEMYAVLQFVSGTQLMVYQFYNNVPFDPFNSSLQQPVNYQLSSFNIPLYFDLGRAPTVQYHLNSSATASTAQSHRQIGGNCNDCKDSSTVVYDNTSNAILPLIVDNLTNSNENSQMIISNYVIGYDLNLNFNSNSGTSVTNGVVGSPVMSSQPSWGATINDITKFGGAAPTDPTAAHNISAVGIPATLHVVRTKFFYVTCYAGTNCELTGTSYSTSVAIVDSPTYNATAEYLTNMKNSPFWGDILGSMGFSPGQNTSATPITPGTSNVYVNVTHSVNSAYSNAASALQTAVGAAATFIGVVGLALALDTATSDIPIVGTATDAINDVNVGLAAACLGLSILSSFTSICFSENLGINTTLLNFENLVYNITTNGTTLYVHELQSSYTTTLQLSSAYSMNTPSLLFNVSP